MRPPIAAAFRACIDAAARLLAKMDRRRAGVLLQHARLPRSLIRSERFPAAMQPSADFQMMMRIADEDYR